MASERCNLNVLIEQGTFKLDAVQTSAVRRGNPGD